MLSQRRFCWVEKVLVHEVAYAPAPALKLFLMLYEPDPRLARQIIQKALEKSRNLEQLSAAQVSLILTALHYEISVDQLELLMESVLSRFDQRHAALGMWCCQRAQEQQVAKDVSQVKYWGLALKFLPVEHPWYAAAAEQLALAGLEPLMPGERLVKPSSAQLDRLNMLVESLSFIAWSGEQEAHLRCRYLLAQALSQRGDLGAARLCFESLLPLANQHRKIRIEKALRTLLGQVSGEELLGQP